MLKKFFKDIFNKGNFKDYFKRNKFYLIFATAIIILSILSGFNNPSSYTDVVNVMISQLTGILPINSTTTDNIIILFINNFCSNIYIIGLGVVFSIPSIILSVFNGVLVGYVFATHPLEHTFFTVAFHGIFELISLILSLTSAFLVTKMEIRLISGVLSKKSKNKLLSRLKTPFKDTILSVAMIIILLVIAAIIEAVVVPVLL